MKWLTGFLVVLIALMQYKLWLAPSSLPEVWRMKAVLQKENIKIQELEKRNHALDAEVQDLKAGHLALEERARADLGMVKQGETYFQLVPERENE